ncbi:hypothetical protein ElyMa_004181600 [Elysia marginata]|uniref:AAA+ ATPase domain-containing protein n=1 Tax=Elysia marginata TaxID=1093978 RepID=A0AAV4GJP1_9GAST|nr:hypothetical protein ElyMa_004181600 [Elysia marginata]
MGFGQRPPPAPRRPYREAIPSTSVWKGDTAANRRPRLDYRSTHEPSIIYHDHSQPPYNVVNGNLPPLPDGWQYCQTVGSYPSNSNQPAQWSSVPMYVAPVVYPNRDHYGPTKGYPPQYLIPVAPVQQNFHSPPLTESSSHRVYSSSRLIPQPPGPNHFAPSPTNMSPTLSTHYSEAARILSESPENDAKNEMEMAMLGGHQAVQQQHLPGTITNGTVQYGHQQQPPMMMLSHPNAVSLPQTLAQNGWLAQSPDIAKGPESSNQYHLNYRKIHSERHELDMIKNLAFKCVEEYCPLLETTAYCHPPVLRSRHPDKASKQLVMGMESEQRVIGTFERFFAANQMPVFMLCHYPVTGFLQERRKKEQTGKESPDKVSASNRETVTLILVSPKFCVTVMTVSIISSNSDFSYIQRGVAKAAGHVAKCGRAVSHWLTLLGLAADVKEVLAFPNLRQSMMQRITRDKALQKSLAKVSLLHLDDLCPPFEEEWSTADLKRQFTEWMHEHVLCCPPSLLAVDVKLFVGALLCPQLSCVENMKNVQSIDPIPEKPKYTDKEPINAEDIGQLQLTINGVTMGFDNFMETYVTSYYPDVDHKTYRVPPLHFNIQSFKKGTEYLESLGKENSSNKYQISSERPLTDSIRDSSNKNDNDEETAGLSDSDSDEDFMPCGRSYNWQAGPVRGRLNSANSYIEDDSSDSEDIPPSYRRWPVEKVTLDSIPDHVKQDNFQGTQEDQKNEGKIHNGMSLRENAEGLTSHLPLAASNRFSSLSHQTNGAPLMLLPQGNIQRESEELTSVASLGVGIHSLSKPLAKSPSLSSEEAQAVMLEETSVMSDVMAKDARADEGENRVINAMELLGQKFGPMFIICSYQYNNYLNKLREEMFSKGEATRPARAFGQIMRAEHDCLIFHKDLGVLVVCIKAIGDNFSDWNASEDQIMSSTAKILHKALKQLEREEAMIRHVTSDLKSRTKLMCHCLVALPNLYRKQVDAAIATDTELFKKIEKLTHGRGTKSFLCLDELPEKNMSVWDPPEESILERLVDWWKKLRSSLDSPDNAIDTRTYKHIIGRYCGLLSTVEVWSPNNPRVEVRSMSEAVNLCAQRFSQVVLLPTQLQVLLSEHNRIYLYGPPGSGKTMLLILKAREWLLRGHTVILINSRWGSTDGYPYAYGILDRLKFMMTKDGVPHDNLVMINVDTSRFHASYLSDVLPSRCVIVDEVTPATLPVIEHLCCLQVQNIWCAGLFQDSRPHTAHHFHAFQMEKVLRCPPIVQSLLKHTEKDAKFRAPYKGLYEESSQHSEPGQFSRQPPRYLKNKDKWDCGEYAIKKETNAGVAKENDDPREEEELKYDPDSLNKRLAKLNLNFQIFPSRSKADPELKISPKAEELSSLISNRTVSGLPTDGPRPHIIDHESHNQPGPPANCVMCGKELSDFLSSMVKNEPSALSNYHFHQNTLKESDLASNITKNAKNKFSSRVESARGRSRKGSGSGYSSGLTRKQNDDKTTVRAWQHSMFENRALSWSDVLIVMSSLPRSSALLKNLQKRGIPLEVVPYGHGTRAIETSNEKQRLFVTTYKEVIGLERALIVFVPSGAVDNLGPNREEDQLTELKNLSLRKCLQRYNEDDRRALWFMASRCLSDLVLLLP